MPTGSSKADEWAELNAARRRVAELESNLSSSTREMNLPTASMRQMLASAGVGLWEWTIATGEVRWSDGIAQLFGLLPSEFDGSYATFLDLLQDDARQDVERAVAQALAHGTSYQVEHAVHPPFGPPRWVLARGEVHRDELGNATAIVGLVADLTERKESQRRLAESEERFRAFADAATEGIAFSIDGRLIDVSDRLCQLLGRSRSELTGSKLESFVHPADAPVVASMIAHREAVTCRHRILTKDGTLRHVESCGRNVVYQGRTARMAALRDVTEEVHLTEEHHRIIAQLIAAKKMEAVGQIAGGLAHDFNNIMMVMLGNLAMAISDLEEGLPVGGILEGLQDAVTSGKRAVDLIAQLLAYTRKQPRSPKTIALASTLDQLARMLRPVIPESISLKLEVDDDLPPVFIDPGQLQQVVMNLALNARDAMPEGGSLTVGATLATDRDAGTAGERFVRLYVKDDGCGVSPELRTRIFEPFFTTKSPGTGSGLGLSTAHGIVQQAGGSIRLEGEVGRGATFSVYLCPTREEPEQPT